MPARGSFRPDCVAEARACGQPLPQQPHIRDTFTVATLDAIQTKYEAKGRKVTVVGLNDASQERDERLAGHLASGHRAVAVFARNPPPTLPRQGRNVIDSRTATPRHTATAGKAARP